MLKRIHYSLIREFTDTTCAWADKGHFSQKGKTHRDEYWICPHESYVTLFIYAPTVHSMIRRWKYSFQEGKQKVFMKRIWDFGSYYSNMLKVELLHV